MAGVAIGALIGGVTHTVDKYKQKRKDKQRAASDAARHEERETRFQSEKDRLAQEDRDNAAGEGSSSQTPAPLYSQNQPALRDQAPHLNLDLPTYDEVAHSSEGPVPEGEHVDLPPYNAPMSPRTEQEFQTYCATRQRSKDGPEGETEEEARKRKIEEFWKLRGGGWWSMVGYSMVRGFATI